MLRLMNNIERSHYYERKILNIQEQCLPPNHPHLAFAYNPIM